MSNNDKIHCPNCSEDVPKTLYCLNCGYPLYKLENQITSENDSESTPLDVEVDMTVGTEPFEEVTNEEPEVELEIETPPEPVIEMEDSHETESSTVEELEIEEEPVSEIGEEEETPVESEVEPDTDTDSEEIGEIEVPEIDANEPPLEEPIEITEEPIEVSEEPMVHPFNHEKEPESYMIEDTSVEYVPDPLMKEVMDNLAKNITLKIRLTKLLIDNAVKEETFKKLFDSYVDQGIHWVSRREEIVNRLKSDRERMEHKLVTARKDFELLEIRKSIGDASDNEYNIKAPAFKWDIEHLETDIHDSVGGIQYLMDLQSMIQKEEIEELEKLAQTDYSELENVLNVGPDTIKIMKDSLSEALDTINKE